MKNKKGSTIVWAITLIMVLVVIVGASLSFAYMSYNQSIKNRNKTQVELIANSAIKSLAGAIENDENSSQLIPDTGKQINVSKMECSVPYGTISNIKKKLVPYSCFNCFRKYFFNYHFIYIRKGFWTS